MSSIAEQKESEGASFLTKEALAAHNAKVKVNNQFYKQPQAVLTSEQRQEFAQASRELDKSIDRFFRSFCKALIEEGRGAEKGGSAAQDILSLADRYGKESPGFISY